MSAGLVAMAARVSGDLGAVAQAESIREHVTPLAGDDARAYRQCQQSRKSGGHGVSWMRAWRRIPSSDSG